jgi:3-oxoacyl-[acyl-carrier protein] reductase
MKNKNIIITGASKGLGHDLAINLSKDNNKLFLISRDLNKLNKLKNKCHFSSKHKVFSSNLLFPDETLNIYKEVKKFFKNKIHIIIHCAGGGLGLKETDINSSDLLKLLNLNILSSIELNRLLIPSMKKKKSGKIIHIGSIASNEAVGSLGYNIAKASLHAYVKTLGRDLAKNNIVLSGIAPGGFISKDNAMDRLKNKNIKAYKNFIKERLPRGKMGKTSEIIPLIKFLCSENSGMMSGCLIPIDGGESKNYSF